MRTLRTIYYSICICLILISPLSFANICGKLQGRWIGNWEQFNNQYSAKLEIHRNSNKNFSGKYELSDNSKGKFHGTCKQILTNEAYLILDQDPPWNNPCRGILMQIKTKMSLHFSCFNPNQSGYFLQQTVPSEVIKKR